MKKLIKKKVQRTKSKKTATKSALKSTIRKKAVRSKKAALNGFKYKYLGSKKNRIKCLSNHGNLITFKSPFFVGIKSYRQIIVKELVQSKSGKAKIRGLFFDTPEYSSLDKLIELVDWELMDEGWKNEAEIKGENFIRLMLGDDPGYY